MGFFKNKLVQSKKKSQTCMIEKYCTEQYFGESWRENAPSPMTPLKSVGC